MHTRASINHPSSHGAALFRIEGAALSNMFVGSAPGFDRYPFRLASNVNLNTASPFNAMQGSSFAELAFHGGQANDHWLAGGTGFIGFRFNGGSGMEFGWARITMDGTISNTFTWSIMPGAILVLSDSDWSNPGTGFAGTACYRCCRTAGVAQEARQNGCLEVLAVVARKFQMFAADTAASTSPGCDVADSLLVVRCHV